MKLHRRLHILPEKTMDAFAQMAEDLLLLEAYPQPQAVRLRHYCWERPAFTFGYSQQYAWVTEQVPLPVEAFEICRRATGGGVVDHRSDFTYSLVLPPEHLFYREQPQQLYRLTHEVIVESLLKNNQEARLQSSVNNDFLAEDVSRKSSLPTVCFQRTETHDVIHPPSQQKIAGAALKRNRFGLLLQGSIEKAVATEVVSWSRFWADFIDILQTALNVEATAVDYPVYDSETELGLKQKFRSQEWNQRR